MSVTRERPADPDSEQGLIEAVLAANRMFVAVATSALASLAPDVTLPQFRTLVLLDQRGAMTVAALAEDLGVVPSSATRMCDRLVAKNLVRRVVDPRNRRQMIVSLRCNGHRLISESTERRRQEFARVLGSLPAADRAQVAEALRVLIKAAEA